MKLTTKSMLSIAILNFACLAPLSTANATELSVDEPTPTEQPDTEKPVTTLSVLCDVMPQLCR